MDDHPANTEVVDQLAEEFVARHRRGERPTVAEYVAKYPQHAERIRDLFPALVMMEDIAPGKHSDEVAGPTAAAREEHLQSLGDYRILREVGRGGMGVVYEAEQVSLGRHVALKVLTRPALLDGRQKLRFQREAKAAAKLHHTNIVPVFGVGEHDGIAYYVMQFIQGLGLDDVLDELRRFARAGAIPTDFSSGAKSMLATGAAPATEIAKSLVTGTLGVAGEMPQDNAPPGEIPAVPAKSAKTEKPPNTQFATDGLSDSTLSGSVVLPGQSGASKSRATYWQSVARIGVQVGEALQYAHRQGIVHRDIKPGNLLLDSAGTVWITDFGLAKADDQQNLTHTGDVLGTLRYMAPEMFRGKADARSDVYALGLTLYELLTLQPAFDDSDRHELIRKVTSEMPSSLRKLCPAIPRDLETITNKAIDPDLAHRYQSAGELAEDLQRFLKDEPIAARRITTLGRTWRWCKRSPALAALSGTVLAMLVMLAVGGPLVALRQSALAEAARTQASRADRARDAADRSQRQTRRNLYVAHMNMVQQAWESADVLRVRQLLDRYLPAPGEEDLRGFEWHYWRRLSHQVQAPLVHDGTVWCATFSPNGELLASASADTTIKVWHVAGSKLLHTLHGHGDEVRHVAFSPDGTTLASASDDKTVKLWDVTSGTQRRTLTGHQERVNCVAFSPRGDRLASADGETVRLWDTMTGSAVHTIDVESTAECVAFSPDGAALASGSFDSAVDLWDSATGTHNATLGGHRGRIMSVAFSHDGALLASADSLSEIKLWDAIDHKERLTLRGHKFFVMSVAFSPDGRTLASGSTDNTVKLWDPASGREKATLKGHTYLVNSVDFSPDGKLLASASHDKTIRLWNVDSRDFDCELLEGHHAIVRSIAISPDGAVLASGSDDATVRLWDLETGMQMATLGRHQGTVWGVAFSPDGQRLASSDAGGTVTVWDVTGRRKERSLDQQSGASRAVAFSPDGSTLAASDGSETVRLWDTSTWTTTKILTAPGGGILSMAVSPDGRILATGSQEGTMRIWDLTSGAEQRSLQATGEVHAVAFSPDGRLLAFAHDDENTHTIRLWDVASAAEKHLLKGHTWVISSLSFSPDGKTLASASWDFTTKLWNVRTGEVTATLQNHTSHVRCVAFSPVGKTLASGGDDRSIKVWRGGSP